MCCLVGHPGTKLFRNAFVDVIDIYSTSEYGVVGVTRGKCGYNLSEENLKVIRRDAMEYN